MPDDSPKNDPQTIWQDQPMEAPTMTLEGIREKAREYRSKKRRALLGSIVTVLLIVAISIFGIQHGSGAGVRMLFALAIFWALAGQSFLHRRKWQPGLPDDANLSTGLEFYRRELEQQQDLVRRILQWSLGPVILSVLSLIVVLVKMATGRGLPISRVLPFTILFIVWLISFFVLRSRDQKKLRREIDELRNVETASRR